MNCLSVIVRRIGGLTASAQRTGGMTASARRVCGDLQVSVGLVCSTGLCVEGIIWASDGRLITLEGGFLIPRQ